MLHVVIISQQIVQVVVGGKFATKPVLSHGLFEPNNRFSHVNSSYLI